MTKEKQLLVKALCGYWPYGVICSVVHKKDGRLVEEDMKANAMAEGIEQGIRFRMRVP